MTREETYAYLAGFGKSGKPIKDLSRIRGLLAEVGNPQDSLHFVHVAGTNGKGSVTAYVSHAAMQAGFRTATFTSPYVRHYTDRIQINGEDIPEEELCRFCEMVRNTNASTDCSQFEISFAIALLWFQQEQCDFVVLETGVGGLLDATNVITNPLVCAITSVSFDHMALLGNTLTEIAAQKAGIIKPCCPVVLAPDNAMDVTCLVQETAEQKHAQLRIPSMLECHILDEGWNGSTFVYHGSQYHVSMTGRHQIYNALTAIEVIRFLGMHGYLITASHMAKALEEVQVPARTQVIQRENPMIVLDGAHNQSGINALANLLRKNAVKPITILTGMLKSKDYTTGCGILSTVADRVICTDGFTVGTVPAEELASLFPNQPTETATIAEGLERCIGYAKEEKGTAVICGSLYLTSEILDILKK